MFSFYQALDQNVTATRLLQELRQSKTQTEADLREHRRKSDMNSALKERLSLSEVSITKSWIYRLID